LNRGRHRERKRSDPGEHRATNGEIRLENRNGIIMRFNAAQAGLTFTQRLYEFTIRLSQ
jgi:hypothetical protein